LADIFELPIAKGRASVECRFHDLRDTGCTRMPEAGVPFSAVATIMRMERGHYGTHGEALRTHRAGSATCAWRIRAERYNNAILKTTTGADPSDFD